MLNTIITSLIKHYLSRYIDINADQLSTQLLYKQQIVIENLQLNRTAINQDIQMRLKLPIAFESINIGKVQCSFAWTSLFLGSSSTAFIIKIDGVHAIINTNENKSSTVTIDDHNQTEKCYKLNLTEQQLEKEFECFGDIKSSRSNFQRLLMLCLKKLQIEIVDVHISYKISTTSIIGMTCDSIVILNEPANKSIDHQIFRINNPGFYVDINNPLKHSYILSPSNSIEIYLKHNHFITDRKETYYEFSCSLNKFHIKCYNEQIQLLADMLQYIQNYRFHQSLILDTNRPCSRVSKQNVKSWWRFASLSVLRTNVHSTNFTKTLWFNRTLLIHRLHQLINYKHVYRLYLNKKYFQDSKFSSQDECTMHNIEVDFNIEYLILIRRSIFRAYINEQVNVKKAANKWYTNYAKWITSKWIELWGPISTSDLSSESLNENDIKIQDQVNTFIAESLEREDLLLDNNIFMIRFEIILNTLQLDLLSNNTIVFDININNLSFVHEFRSNYQHILFSVYLADLQIHDRRQMDRFSTIICSKEQLNSE